MSDSILWKITLLFYEVNYKKSRMEILTLFQLNLRAGAWVVVQNSCILSTSGSLCISVGDNIILTSILNSLVVNLVLENIYFKYDSKVIFFHDPWEEMIGFMTRRKILRKQWKTKFMCLTLNVSFPHFSFLSNQSPLKRLRVWIYYSSYSKVSY